jgi:hypothetical protein
MKAMLSRVLINGLSGVEISSVCAHCRYHNRVLLISRCIVHGRI